MAQVRKTVTVQLVQGNKGLSFPLEIESNRIDEIGGTIAHRIKALFLKSKKYKMNLGFSFARKFDVKISIDGQSIDGTTSILNGAMEFGLTIQNNKESLTRFVNFIDELTTDLLTGTSNEVYTLDEVLAELN